MSPSRLPCVLDDFCVSGTQDENVFDGNECTKKVVVSVDVGRVGTWRLSQGENRNVNKVGCCAVAGEE